MSCVCPAVLKMCCFLRVYLSNSQMHEECGAAILKCAQYFKGLLTFVEKCQVEDTYYTPITYMYEKETSNM